MILADIIINFAVFSVTAGLIFFSHYEKGKVDLPKLRRTFCYFTCQSNVLCAVACLLMAVAAIAGRIPEWIWILKYIGTAAVAVTMLTVFFFLAPCVGKGWVKTLLTDNTAELFMHLITPLIAIFSFSVFEKRGMTFFRALFGMLPVILYGSLYIWKVIYAPEDRRWKDFYGFNKSGRIILPLVAMLAGTFLVCMGLMLLQNR